MMENIFEYQYHGHILYIYLNKDIENMEIATLINYYCSCSIVQLLVKEFSKRFSLNQP